MEHRPYSLRRRYRLLDSAVGEKMLGNQGWREAERLSINVDAALRELVRDRSRRDPLALLARMARHKVG